jgi:hypothetical protein
MPSSSASYGITLLNGCTIVHGNGANIKRPFPEIPLDMHEMNPGGSAGTKFAGQFGFIEFSTDFRLPRHVHIAPPSETPGPEQKFVGERIVVLNGVALVELNKEIYVIPPKSLVTIAPGVPHTWTACPPGVSIPSPKAEGAETAAPITSTGTFLMLYEYEEPTAFFPTAQVNTLTKVEEYERCDDLESIRIPKLSAVDVQDWCWFVSGKTLTQPTEAGVVR